MIGRILITLIVISLAFAIGKSLLDDVQEVKQHQELSDTYKVNNTEIQEFVIKDHVYIGYLSLWSSKANFLTHAGHCPCNNK